VGVSQFTLALQEDRKHKAVGQVYVQNEDVAAYCVLRGKLDTILHESQLGLGDLETPAFLEDLVTLYISALRNQVQAINADRPRGKKRLRLKAVPKNDAERAVEVEKFRRWLPKLITALHKEWLIGTQYGVIPVYATESKHGLIVGVQLTEDPQKKAAEEARMAKWAATAELKRQMAAQHLLPKAWPLGE